jgi:hypothetical protein
MSLLIHTGIRRRGRNPGSEQPGHTDRAELVLSPEQQDRLRAAGFGADGPALDFEDPAVRADLVRALIACGALRPGTEMPTAPPRETRRAG